MLYKIISGGQAGADIAGIKVGLDLGLQTGGHAPLGYRTKFGNKVGLKKYGLIEHSSPEYKPRTYLNVKNSDATIRFATNFNSGGEICTLNAIHKYNKPYFDIDLNEWGNILIFDVMDFFHKNNVGILNVAGNAGKTEAESKKIFKLVKMLLTRYVSTYNEKYKLKDVWTISDMK